MRYEALTADMVPQVYVPHAQDSWNLMNIVVRAATDAPDALTPILRREIAAMDPLLALSHVRTLAGAAQASIARERYTTLLLSLLAATAVFLGASVSTASSATRCRRCGASSASASRSVPRPSHLYALVFRQVGTLLAAGLVLGLLGAWFAAQCARRACSTKRSPPIPPPMRRPSSSSSSRRALATMLPAWRAAHADPIVAIK